ncbi:unnamed protein product, partial [marine sediment metagenome]
MTKSVDVIEPSKENEIESEGGEVKVIVTPDTFTENSYIKIEVNPTSEEITEANEKVQALKNLKDTITELNAFTLNGKKLEENDFNKKMDIRINYNKAKIDEEEIAED